MNDTMNNDKIDFFSKMLMIRLVEEKIEYGITRGQVQGTTHLCIGQEAVPVGVSANLTNSDYVVSNHRNHGHYLAFTEDYKGLMKELMGELIN